MAETVIAAVGDVHGAQHALIDLVRRQERAAGVAVDVVLQVGDFEGNRDEADRAGRAPDAQLGDFPEFVAGRVRFPWPVWFLGGNHEPYRWLDTLAPGAEVAPGCRWLGWVGERRIAGLRVAWLSGIHSAKSFPGERPNAGMGRAWKQSTYFTAADLERLRGISRPDLLLLHDWPAGLVPRGAPDPFAGTPVKPWFVGNPHARALIESLRPRLALCGHLHVGYRGAIGATRVRCLAAVADGDAACALFRAQAGVIEELT